MVTFPVVLSAEELYALRLMLRAVMLNRLRTTTTRFKEVLLATAHGSPDDSSEIINSFPGTVIDISDDYRQLDLPLFHAGAINPNKTVVISLVEYGYATLKAVAETKIADSHNAKVQATVDRMAASRPAILRAFEIAREQAMSKVIPNQPAATALN